MFVVFVYILEFHDLRPMPHFQSAIDYLLEEFPRMFVGYIEDTSYQMATVLDPQYGPIFFRDWNQGISIYIFMTISIDIVLNV